MTEEKSAYKILFVEDEKDIRDNYTRYLKRHFKNVYEAVDGEDGYKVYKDKKPDIMILDINLPKLSGIDLLKQIRKTDHIVKVIMLTAYSDTKYLLDASELKLVKYLVKPITRNDLKSALDITLAEFTKFDIISKESIYLEDGFSWDCNVSCMYKNASEVTMTNKETKILKLLLSNPNNVFTYNDIILEVWDSFENDKIDPLKTLVKNIRKKLPKDTIKNVFGVGYKY